MRRPLITASLNSKPGLVAVVVAVTVAVAAAVAVAGAKAVLVGIGVAVAVAVGVAIEVAVTVLVALAVALAVGDGRIHRYRNLFFLVLLATIVKSHINFRQHLRPVGRHLDFPRHRPNFGLLCLKERVSSSESSACSFWIREAETKDRRIKMASNRGGND